MSIGIRLHDTAGDDIYTRAQNARAQGFACVHLALSKTMSASHAASAALTPGFASHLRATLAPLDTAVLGCYLNLAHPDPDTIAGIQATYTAHLRFASWLGAGVVGTETGNPNAQYRFDPVRSHSKEALDTFIRNLRPVVTAAEKLGTVLAIEPVYTHIVCDAPRARQVLDTIASPNLQIILDPVNLLHTDNLLGRDEVLSQAVALLAEDIAVLHVKDYVMDQGSLQATAAGMGLMNYKSLFQALAPKKPHLYITLENTSPHNALAAREHVQQLWYDALNS